ncbi:uracil-DNA glycosylase [Halalkalicoccus salilacus]|uniref:uracil-DNA glycosylase n=1 Tax=Halalkalicoccus salilacus TaxID=3117459 RepID=UPI00300E78AA
MDANQRSRRNPFGMDEECTNCPELCETREEIAHGYGDVAAEFVFVGERPTEGADETGIPFFGDERGEALQDVLRALGFATHEPGEKPEIENAYLTLLTRCRHPERPPTDEEIGNCEPYLSSEIRMINPEIIVPVGERALRAIAEEYTTSPAEEFDVETHHGEEIRGRGFEIVPMIDPAEASEEEQEAFLESFSELLGRDYRQTKGRRGR